MDCSIPIIGLYFVLNLTIAILVIKFNFKPKKDVFKPIFVALLSLLVGVPLMLFSKVRSENEDKDK